MTKRIGIHESNNGIFRVKYESRACDGFVNQIWMSKVCFRFTDVVSVGGKRRRLFL